MVSKQVLSSHLGTFLVVISTEKCKNSTEYKNVIKISHLEMYQCYS